jgi:hypothetical protein
MSPKRGPGGFIASLPAIIMLFGSTLPSNRMTENDKFLLAMLEDIRPGQLDPLFRIAERKGKTFGEIAVTAMREYLDSMAWQEREEAIEILREGGIDWEKIR